MIFDNIAHLETYRELRDLYTALQFLAKQNSLPEGRVELDGARIFANPVTLTSKPQSECLYEAHRRYADVHFILSGVEGVSVREVSALTEHTPYDAERDIGFYDGAPSGTLWLHPGDFLVCYPQDAHRVAMLQDAPGYIEKIVVKLCMD